MKVIDVDGTYLEKKRERLIEADLDVPPLPIPTHPVQGLVKLSESPSLEENFPSISQGTLYTYLAEGVGNTKGKKAFRALKRGYIHFTSSSIEAQNRHPLYTFVKSSMIPSMRTGTYKVMMTLKKEIMGEQCIGLATVLLGE